jgi:hypothetical protein
MIHHVRSQTLELQVASEEVALRLQPRLADLNRMRLLPAIERVLDELSVPDRHIRIDRLEVDLGAIAAGDLDTEVEERLVCELRRALQKALDGMGEGSGRAGWQTGAAARRELLEIHLLHGSAPFWAPRPPLPLEDLVLSMADGDPGGLVEAIRRLGHHTRVLERLAAQLGEPALERLIGLLEPRHAVLILEYLGDLREVHRTEPVLPVAGGELGRLLWVLVQAYLVRDPGSQFNRKSFVRSLLHGLAGARGLVYAEILATLRLGLERMERRHPLRSSLPAVVAELVYEEGILRKGLPTARAAGARQLLRVVRDAPELRQEILGESPAPLFERMLGQLCPREEGMLRALLHAFASIPAPYRPRPESLVRQVVFDEALRLGPGEPLTEVFFTRVLRELFAWPLAEPVRGSLLEAAAVWSGSGRLPATRIEAFRSAVGLAAGSAPLPVAPDQLTDGELRSALLEMLGDPPEDAGPALRRQAADRRTRERWARVLPESALARLAELIEPRKHRELREAAEVLATAGSALAALPGGRRAFWSFLLEVLAHPRAERAFDRLVAAFLERSAVRFRIASPESILESAERLARDGGHHALLAALQRGRRLLPAAPPRRAAPARSRRLPRPALETTAGPDPIYIDNAGLALASAFLPPLFNTLGMLSQEEDGRVRLRDPETSSRAVHLLQFLVDGRTDAPEPLLVLNKLLCGLPLGVPIERGIEPTEQEIEICHKLLRSILAGWPALANTSVEGLRETFLQREGRLERTDEGWRLRVSRKTLDILVDEVPWSLSVSFHGWMPQPLHVSW